MNKKIQSKIASAVKEIKQYRPDYIDARIQLDKVDDSYIAIFKTYIKGKLVTLKAESRSFLIAINDLKVLAMMNN